MKYVVRNYVLSKLTNPNYFIKVTIWDVRINQNIKERVSLYLKFFKLASFESHFFEFTCCFSIIFP